jgi:hypothetical protein
VTIGEGLERSRWGWHARFQDHDIGFDLLPSYLKVEESAGSIIAAVRPVGSLGTDDYSSQKVNPASFGDSINEDFRIALQDV